MFKSKPNSTFKTETKKLKQESLGEERTLLTWKAPLRPFKKRGREYFTTIGITIVLLVVILLFLKEFLLIGVILALAFVAYILATVPPENGENKITTRGVTTAGHYYPWDNLSSFWFSETYSQKILNLKTVLGFPGRVFFLLGELKEAEVKKVLLSYLKFEEELPSSFLDDAARLLTKSFPLGKR